jgi:hypothetical protein
MALRSLIAILVLALASCAEPPDLSAEQAARLVKACDVIAARHLVVHDIVYPPEEAWPEAIVQLKPERVSVDSKGVYLRTHSGWVTESGYFVPKPAPASRSKPPGREADPAFEQIAPRLYKYRIKG